MDREVRRERVQVSYGGTIKKCTHCGCNFTTSGRNQKYCSTECWRKENYEAYTGLKSKRKKKHGL